MLDINRVTLLGRAGRDPEIRELRSGERAASFTLATTQKWTGKDGQRAQATEWHRIAVFGGAVKAVEAMVARGAAVLVEGRIARREYQDREGKAQKITEIVVAGPQVVNGMVNVVSPRPKDAGPGAGAPEGSGDDGEA